MPVQTHSNNVRVVNVNCTYTNTDGLVNYGSNKILTLLTADCIPLFIYDKIKKYIFDSLWVARIINRYFF